MAIRSKPWAESLPTLRTRRCLHRSGLRVTTARCEVSGREEIKSVHDERRTPKSVRPRRESQALKLHFPATQTNVHASNIVFGTVTKGSSCQGAAMRSPHEGTLPQIDPYNEKTIFNRLRVARRRIERCTRRERVRRSTLVAPHVREGVENFSSLHGLMLNAENVGVWLAVILAGCTWQNVVAMHVVATAAVPRVTDNAGMQRTRHCRVRGTVEEQCELSPRGQSRGDLSASQKLGHGTRVVVARFTSTQTNK